jgi:uroporphyrinogen-III decarboxylase
VKSQTTLILEHLLAGNTLTPKQAERMPFCCMRLAARICDIRRRGYQVLTDTVKHKSHRTGKPIAYARYKIQGM